jgi:hypothetical protein
MSFSDEKKKKPPPFRSCDCEMVRLSQDEMIETLGCEIRKNKEHEPLLVLPGMFPLERPTEEKEKRNPNDEFFMTKNLFKFKWIRLLRPKNENPRFEEKGKDEILWEQSRDKEVPAVKEPERFSIEKVRRANRPAALVLVGPASTENCGSEEYRRLDGIVAALNYNLKTSLAVDRSEHPSKLLMEGRIDKVVEIGEERLHPPGVREQLRVLIIPVVMIEFIAKPNPAYGEKLFELSKVRDLNKLWCGNDADHELQADFSHLEERFGEQRSFQDVMYCCDFIFRKVTDQDDEPVYIVKGDKRVRMAPNTFRNNLAWVKPKKTDNSRLLNEEDGRKVNHKNCNGSSRRGGSDFYCHRDGFQGGYRSCDVFY